MAKRRGTRIDTIAALDMETFKPLFGFGAQHFGAIAKAMGVRFPSAFSSTLANALPANATETIICTTPPLTLPLDNAQVILASTIQILAGTGTTALILQIRRGTLVTSPLVATGLVHTLAAAANALLSINLIDPVVGAFGGLQYSLTIQQNNATAAGVLGLQTLLAFCL